MKKGIEQIPCIHNFKPDNLKYLEMKAEQKV